MSATTSHYPLQPPENSGSTNQKQQSQHKRVYQACIPCRRRKVKCNLGSVDNPHDPPCTRCRRESKDCYFSATRRKRKVLEEDGSADGYEFDDDYVVRNGRKRVQSEASSETPTNFRQSVAGGVPSSAPRSSYMDSAVMSPPQPLTPGGHPGRAQPLRRPSPESSSKPGETERDDSNMHYENPEAKDVMRREVYGPHDALDLLYKAATDSPGHKGARTSSVQLSSNGHTSSPDIQRRVTPRNDSHTPGRQMGPPDVRRDARIDPALSAQPDLGPNRVNEPGYKDAIKAWSRFRFVRAGWFTPIEAIDYIDYYYEYLSPLTPISPPTFRNPGTHPTLLNEEPILSVTLLTISSRYRQMPGPGGHCRSHAIHEQLWTYLRGMIERCFWGQESFGGGFCGQGATEGEQISSTAPWRGLRRGSLRTLGTVESLMILTEWHPRALHFPPQEATDELMLPSYDGLDSYSVDEDGNHKPPGGLGGKRIESWLEPAWRSDRMCWMLLNTAMGLSYELGVFDQIDELVAAGGEIQRPEYEDEAYRLRAGRIKKLVLLYLTQLAGRLGWTNMVPENLRGSNAPEHRKRKTSTDGNTPGTNATPGTIMSASNAFNYIPDLELDDQIIHCWEGITHAMRIANERLFLSRRHTTTIIQNGDYINLLKDFQPIFRNWMKTFEGYRLPQYMKHILVIEYEYVRIYVNSLSLQAVVERCTSNAGSTGNQNGNTNGVLALSPETQNYYGKLPLAHLGGFTADDQLYVRQVVDGSRNLLRTVVEGLLPGGYLKHAPVRTYFRIISGAMFLLKTFALGASKNDVEVSIGLMDKSVDALRHCIVDDVHLGIRFADLLETLTSRLRNRFMHAPMPPPSVGQDLSSAQTQQHRLEQRPFEQLNKAEDQQGSNNTGWTANTPGFHDSGIEGGFNSGTAATPADLGPGAFFGNATFSNGSSIYDLPDQVYGEAGEWNGASDFWYLPPGPGFFQNSDQAITQTADGVNVGGIDLLDYMMDQYTPLDTGAITRGF